MLGKEERYFLSVVLPEGASESYPKEHLRPNFLVSVA